MIILILAFISIAAGLLLLFLKKRLARSLWQTAMVGAALIWALLLISGPTEEALVHAGWQVTPGQILYFEFSLPPQAWVVAVILIGLFLLRLLTIGGGSTPESARNLPAVFGLLGISLLAMGAANPLTLVLIWTLFDSGFFVWEATQGKPPSRGFILGMGSILLLMMGSILDLGAFGESEALLFVPINYSEFIILLAAGLRFLSSVSWGDESSYTLHTPFSDLPAMLSGGLGFLLLVHFAPFSGLSPALMTISAGIFCMLGIYYSLTADDGLSALRGLNWPYAALVLGILTLPSEVQRNLLASVGGLWALKVVFQRFAFLLSGWQRWGTILFPLAQCGLPFMLGNALLSASIFTEGVSVPVELVFIFSMLIAAVNLWRRWDVIGLESLKPDRFTLFLQVSSSVILLFMIVFAGIQLGTGFRWEAAIAAGVLVGTSFLLTRAFQKTSIIFNPSLVGLKGTTIQTKRVYRGMVNGIRSLYDYGIGFASDIVEGSGGTLWIIVILLMLVIGLRNLGV
ncbi:MAG: hypothetical protein JXA97_08665 [Anaerolineales bacterium]|nr:hypothetical protein [Anaerolineales bacterium]